MKLSCTINHKTNVENQTTGGSVLKIKSWKL